MVSLLSPEIMPIDKKFGLAGLAGILILKGKRDT
jgi:hypothetical protein